MKTALTFTAATILIVGWAIVHRASDRAKPAMTQEQSQLSSTIFERKPRLSAPRLPFTPPPVDAEAEARPATNLFTRLLNGDAPRLTPEQVEPYLRKTGRSVESLLGAFYATGDRAFLREAAEKNPDDPRANFAAYFLTREHPITEPASAESRQRLEAFAKTAPDNALPNYLLAFDDFKSGKTDQAVQQLLAAAQKSKFQDYSREFIQNAEDAYRAAGWSEAEAKAVAAFGLMLPHLVELKQAGLKTTELAQLYRQNGDEASAQAALQLALGLGQRLDGGEPLTTIEELVGFAIERRALAAMDPASVIGDTGQTVQGRLDAINQRRKDIKEISSKEEAILPTLSEPDLVSFFDRVKVLGEDAAVLWLVKTHSSQPSP
jgi:tetratricopeptide (TPR) repeat protein